MCVVIIMRNYLHLKELIYEVRASDRESLTHTQSGRNRRMNGKAITEKINEQLRARTNGE